MGSRKDLVKIRNYKIYNYIVNNLTIAVDMHLFFCRSYRISVYRALYSHLIHYRTQDSYQDPHPCTNLGIDIYLGV